MYPSSNTSITGRKNQKYVSYECKRKYCTFCLRNVYDENVKEIFENKNWHCHHCTGICMCTRCLRQDIIT